MDFTQLMEVLSKIFEILQPHWAFVVVSIILAMIGEVMKAVIIGKDKEKSIKTPWKKFFVDTMILHPILAGALIGLALGSLVPSAVATSGLIGSVLYFAFAGAMSTWLYRLLKELQPIVVASIKSLISKMFARVGASVPPPEKEEKTEEN